MEEIRSQQLEALLGVHGYIKRLQRAIPNVNKELRGEKQADTAEYIRTILNGVNYTIEVLRLTMDYLNQSEELINKEEINSLIKDFGQEFKSGQDEKIADAFDRDILVYLNTFDQAINKVCA